MRSIFGTSFEEKEFAKEFEKLRWKSHKDAFPNSISVVS